MPEISLATFRRDWAQECGKGLIYPPPGYYARLPRRPPPFGNDRERMREWRRENPEFRVMTTEENAFVVQRLGRGNRPMVELARYLPVRGGNDVVLLNGDGFEDRQLQALQASLRQDMEARFQSHFQRMIVPYAALEAARLELLSIVPIHISRDRNTSNRVTVPKPSAGCFAKIPRMTAQQKKVSKYDSKTTDFTWKGRQYRAVERGYLPNLSFSISHQPEFAPQAGWHQIESAYNEDVTKLEEWTIVERVHRLGESVFRARVVGESQTHRWISGFDQNENPPMYFLAQLPDTGGIRYITHAVRALMPPIVVRARKDGRRVFRQGDIFAVETDLTDDDMARYRIMRREDFIDSIGGVLPFTTTRWGRKLKRRLMIYGTGHTAARVCPTPRGTFIKDSMHHDPILENVRAGRQPEHREVTLEGHTWFLAVRNTVPRQASTDST